MLLVILFPSTRSEMAFKVADRKFEILLFGCVVVLLICGPLYIGRHVGRFAESEELTLALVSAWGAGGAAFISAVDDV